MSHRSPNVQSPARSHAARWVALIPLLDMAGCAPYWIRTHDPIPVTAIVEVDKPCMRDWLGCANYYARTIELKKGLSPEDRECVIRHELKHMAGYSHDITIPNYRVNCGT